MTQANLTNKFGSELRIYEDEEGNFIIICTDVRADLAIAPRAQNSFQIIVKKRKPKQ